MQLAEHSLSDARRALLQKYLRGEMARPEVKPAIIPRRRETGPAPLSYSQQQIWLHSELARSAAEDAGSYNKAGASLIYNEPITIHRRGELDVFALERSFTEIVHRHEAWRTTFEWDGNQAVQVVREAPVHISIPFIDLRSHPHAEAEALRLATEDAHQPFDLARGLYRLRLARLSDAEHRLFVTLHHLIFDGVSLYRIFMPELLAFYEAFLGGRTPALAELPIQYSDYAAWQRQSVASLDEQHFAYWQRALQDAPVLELKTDRPRPAMETYAGAMEKFEIPASTAARLKAISQDHNSTLFMTLTAAFMALLQDCTGQEDIVIGGISSGRTRDETMELLGCFLNTVPIRCAFPNQFPFNEVLARVRTAILGALSHDEVPFELLVQEFAPKRDPSRAPLVQALIVVEPPLDPLPKGWGFSHTDVEMGTTKFDLQLELDDRAEGLSGRFIYNRDLFDRATIVDLTARWLALLDRIAESPTDSLEHLGAGCSGRPPSAVELSTRTPSAAEDGGSDSGFRERVPCEMMPPAQWSGQSMVYPRDSSIQEIFEQEVRSHPSTVALVFGETEWTYDQLNGAANRLARRLQKLGVMCDVPVGVLMERSPEMVMALLAILKAGGAYVPLDPSYPAERLAFMVEDTGMPVILTHKHLGIEAPSVRCLRLDAEDFASETDSDLATESRAEDLAYIIYTSGSTGLPKGVAVPHRGVVRLVKHTDYITLSPDETFLQLAPISFDASTFEIWGPLLNGGKLALMPAEFPTLKEIGRAVREYQVTTLALTSALFNAMVDEQLEDLHSLRQLLTGGDIISAAHAAKAARSLKSVRLINGYGPTESTTLTCCHAVRAEDLTGDSIPIGRPIANTTVHILHEKLRPVPVGATGELCVGGDGLARGYWRREELTAEKFVADPFTREKGARIYKTGDLARWRNDGVIEFLGRADNQVKLRGFRVELGEIETALKQQPNVRECAVILRETKQGEKQLVAYTVGETSPDKLRTALEKSLPDYMVPSIFVPLTSLPQTPSGKLDRNALPVPDPPALEPSREVVRPYLGLQVQLIEIWQDLLGRRGIGVRDNFFELGGNSLLALRLLHRAEVISGKAVLPAVFFSNPTVEFLADELARQASEESPSILEVNERGAQTPVFYLHGDLFGGGFYSSRLSRALGPDRPFYVLSPFDVRRCPAAPTIEEMAMAHWETLRMVRPRGPYIIGGFCLGGIVAYELAQRMAACGAEVEMLFLIDARPRDKTLWRMRRLCERGERWFGWDEDRQLNEFRRGWLRREQFQLWRQSDARTKARLALRQVTRVFNATGNKFRRQAETANGSAVTSTAPAPHRDVLSTFLWAAAGYRAQKYWGPMVTLLSEDLLHRGDHLEDEWRRLAPKIRVRSLKGSHLECITAHVDNLAETINDVLTRNAAAERSAGLIKAEPVLAN